MECKQYYLFNKINNYVDWKLKFLHKKKSRTFATRDPTVEHFLGLLLSVAPIHSHIVIEAAV